MEWLVTFYQEIVCTERTYRSNADASYDGGGTDMTTKIVIGDLVLMCVREPSDLISLILTVPGLSLGEFLFSDCMRHAA